MPKKIIYAEDAIDELDIGCELLRRALDDTDVVGVERAKYEWGLGLIESYIADIKELPSAQPQCTKGRWLRKESDLSWWYECSECGESPLFDPYENEVLTRFCPWCGADMRGEEE